MRRGRLFLFLAFLVVVGLVVVYFFMQRMQTAGITPPSAQITPTAIPTVEVVVITQHVNRGELISDSVLGTVPYQRDLFIEGMVTNKADVVGKRAKLDLEAGFVVTQNMFTDTPDLATIGSDAALMIPRGMVSISIPIDRLSSVTFAPSRGDHVNVIATMLFVDLDANFQSILPNGSANVLASGKTVLIGPQQASSSDAPSNQGVTLTNGDTISTLSNQSVPYGGPVGRTELDPNYNTPFYVVPSEKQRARLVSQTLIQDVIVLQMGDFTKETPKVTQVAEEGAAPTPTPEPSTSNLVAASETPPDVITLIVTPQDAVTLNYLIYSGAKLTLVLRGSGDDTRVQTEAVTLQFLMDQYKVPIPAKLPYGLEPRIDDLSVPAQYFQPTATPRP
jgi:Flp pilus assembly protein CpaB